MAERPRQHPVLSRRAFGGAALLTLGGVLTGCTGPDPDQARIVLRAEAPATAVLPGDDPARTALALSAALFESANVVVLAAPADVDRFAALRGAAGLPLLVGTDAAVAEELRRLGTTAVVTAPGADLAGLGDLAEELEILEIDPAGADASDGGGAADGGSGADSGAGADGEAATALPEVTVENHPLAVTLFLDPAQEPAATAAARSLIEAAGGTVVATPGTQVGVSGESVAAAKQALGADPSGGPAEAGTVDAGRGALALGTGFGTTEDFTAALTAAATTRELPGGGTVVYPGRRMIAAYGSPNAPSLGILGEQDLPATLTRVQELTAEYEGLTEEPLVPALEIIATIADSDAGKDGDYSRTLPAESLRPWIDAAGEAGVYVVLDLQPGRTDFLTQAKLYEDLLRAPHVGLALDAEWRLAPDQVHMKQIGSVSAAEVNEVSTWLADLTRDAGLPQKVLILHQFRLSMIRDRQDLDTSRPELAITLHADGHGAREDKLATYRALQKDLPEGIHMAWKNFYDEDTPMFTPEETFAVEPRPWFVSYQ